MVRQMSPPRSGICGRAPRRRRVWGLVLTLDAASPVARFLGALDVFVIWWAIVLAIGVSVPVPPPGADDGHHVCWRIRRARPVAGDRDGGHWRQRIGSDYGGCGLDTRARSKPRASDCSPGSSAWSLPRETRIRQSPHIQSGSARCPSSTLIMIGGAGHLPLHRSRTEHRRSISS